MSYLLDAMIQKNSRIHRHVWVMPKASRIDRFSKGDGSTSAPDRQSMEIEKYERHPLLSQRQKNIGTADEDRKQPSVLR